MTMKTKKEIFNHYLKKYLKASRKEKGKILSIICELTSLHRKAIIRKFRYLQMGKDENRKKRGRKEYYTPDSILALKTIWQIASEICGELLHPLIPEYQQILVRDNMWTHTKDATDKLLQMSEATVKRKVGKFLKERNRKKGKSTTKPSHIKTIIPIFSGPWEDKPPGFGQIDTVVHCGGSLLGDMVYSVNYTDVATLWIVLAAQWNKGERATKDSLERMKNKTPFPVLGLHPDSGSEFINYHLLKWSKEENIELTRSRPNKKNDNAYVEQKNGHVIRRFLGYERFDTKKIIPVINELYDYLGLFLNHFVTSRKCIAKVRVGSRYRRKYTKAITPYQRILKSNDINDDIKEKLIKEHDTLNPLVLKEKIDLLIIKILEVQDYSNKNK